MSPRLRPLVWIGTSRILGPAHAELEFIDNPRENTNRDIDKKQLSPKLGHHAKRFIFGLVIPCLHVGDEGAEPERKRDKQKMVDIC